MGKKDGKRVDKEKLEAKKARQASKQTKIDTKRVKKEIKSDSGDYCSCQCTVSLGSLGDGKSKYQDIEAIIAEFTAKERMRTAVSVTPCPQPSPRASFTMTMIPGSSGAASGGGEMLLFGGEYCDGEDTLVYNEVYRVSVEKSEWRRVESLNTPPPRCSHQAVYYKVIESLSA